MVLTAKQKKICDLRLAEHKHKRYEVDIKLADITLKNFIVDSDVFRPETTSGFYLARFLSGHKDLYNGKEILDMCCGSGIQGVVMGLKGAKRVSFRDISIEAVKNAKENVQRFGLSSKSVVSQGDLFDNIKGKFDVIVCNHPFFDSDPLKNEPITRAWFNSGELIVRFLREAPNYLKDGGIILIPFFPFAGKKNDPKLHAKKQGYKVEIIHNEIISDENIQKGEFIIYGISL